MPQTSMPHAIPFKAILYPRDEHVGPNVLAQRVQEVLPAAIVDWEAGDRYTDRAVETYAQMNIPDFYLEDLRRCYGKRFLLSVEVAAEPKAVLSGIVQTVHRDLGDSLEFELHPYKVAPLIQGARLLSEALGFDYVLEHEVSFWVRAEPMPCVDPLTVARERLPIPLNDDPVIRVVELADWRKSTRGAILEWLRLSDHKCKFNEHTNRFESLSDYAHAATLEIESIGPPVRAWSFDVEPWSHQNGILLDQGSWTSFIDLGGVPKGIVT